MCRFEAGFPFVIIQSITDLLWTKTYITREFGKHVRASDVTCVCPKCLEDCIVERFPLLRMLLSHV